MKKNLLGIIILAGSIVMGAYSYFGTEQEFQTAENLASQGIIVDRESIDEYGLTSYVLRQEVVGIGLRLAGVFLPEDYLCQGYFVDATFTSSSQDSWVCRAFELAADNGFVSRRFDLDASLRNTRPQSLITRSEALAILLQSAGITIDRSVSTTLSMQLWQYQVLYSAHKENIVRVHEDPQTNALSFGVNTQATRAEIFGYAQAILDVRKSTQACKKLGEYAGGGLVPYSENSEDFQCCSQLSNVAHKDSYRVADSGNVCANINDGICDEKYESWYNSPDCEKPVDTSTCESYYDGCNWCYQTTIGGPASCTKRACFRQEQAYCNACLDGYTLQNGECVQEVSSLDTTGCTSYYDGCNSCSVGEDGQSICTLRFCSQPEAAYCSACEDGYTLKNGSCEKNTPTSNEPNYDLSVCTGYYDGCNTCSVQNSTLHSCTEVSCIQSERPYCSDYAYTITDYESDTQTLQKVNSNIKEYTRDLTCTDSSQCEVLGYGYKACGGPSEYITYSKYRVSKSALVDQAEQYKRMLIDYYEAYDIVSTCTVIDKPEQISCESGMCVAK